VGKVATVTGRFYAMDRGKHWEQTEMTYQAIVNGIGEHAATAEEAILNNYNKNIFDEMIPPTVIIEPGPDSKPQPVARVTEHDAVIFSNFRSDRALQLTLAFVKPDNMQPANPHPTVFCQYDRVFFWFACACSFPTH
jgi:2,3-bisphosphoglycerate-independent phosphoglycerate mutase